MFSDTNYGILNAIVSYFVSHVSYKLFMIIQAGPMARTMTDLTMLLDAMIPEDERHENHPPSFTQTLLKNKNSVRMQNSFFLV